MKNKLLLLTIVIIVTATGCDKINPAITFTLKHQTAIQVNSATLINTPFEVSTPDMATNSSQEFENNNTASSLVKEVSLQEIKLTITNPPGKTFSFLNSIHIYIATDDNDEVELAFLENIPPNDTSINLITTKLNLGKYIKASSYKLRTKLETRETLSQTTDINVDLKFKVVAALSSSE